MATNSPPILLLNTKIMILLSCLVLVSTFPTPNDIKGLKSRESREYEIIDFVGSEYDEGKIVNKRASKDDDDEISNEDEDEKNDEEFEADEDEDEDEEDDEELEADEDEDEDEDEEDDEDEMLLDEVVVDKSKLSKGKKIPSCIFSNLFKRRS